MSLRIANGMIRRVAAPLSLGLSVTFLALLATLHVLEPEFNSGHLISEYQLGDYGFLMSLAFCLLGVSALLLAVSLWPRLHTRGGRVGWWWLLIIGAAFLSRVFFLRSRPLSLSATCTAYPDLSPFSARRLHLEASLATNLSFCCLTGFDGPRLRPGAASGCFLLLSLSAVSLAKRTRRCHCR
jgi:Protein of unknown function (DUF998)